MPQKLFFSGNTLQQALLAAARHFQIDPEEVAFQPRERRHGFVKGSGKVVIEVDPQAPRRGLRAPGAAAPQDAPPPPAARAEPPAPPPAARPAPSVPPLLREPALPAASGTAADTAREALRELLALGGLDLEATISQGPERLEIELAGPDQDLVVAEDGELLQALEHLLSRGLRGALGESLSCRLDAGGFRRGHEARLEGMARAAAEEARRSGVPQRLPRMNPADRRVIHVTLAEEPGVTTASDGDGVLKTVVVRPA